MNQLSNITITIHKKMNERTKESKIFRFHYNLKAELHVIAHI